jgi:hypothetical protein
VNVRRQGDDYTAQVGPPSISQMWMTDHPYKRDELRSTIEALGVNPIDVADAFDSADARAARGNRPSAEEIRLGEQMWPRDVPDEQHVAAIMAGSGASEVEAKLMLDLVRGDTDMHEFRKQLFWQRVRRFFRWA